MQLAEATLCRFCAAELIPIHGKPHTTRSHRPDAAAFLDQADDCALCDIIRNNWSLGFPGHAGVADDGPETSCAVPITVSLREVRELESRVSWALLRVESSIPHDNRLRIDEFSITTCKINCKSAMVLVPILTCHLPRFPRLTRRPTASASNRGIWSPAGSSVPEKLSTIRSWLNSCMAGHARCDMPATTTGSQFLPRRLLQVGSSECRLVDTTETAPSDARFVALSHCWGAAPPIRTLRQNLDSFHKAIPPAALPRTFLDAITIVRALGIRYLWIDALCIVQDDPADWEAEAARMKDFYAESVLTIAASDASQGSEGCLGPPAPASQTPLGLFAVRGGALGEISELVRVQKGDTRDAVRRTILSSRGWTFQEQILSRRILHCMGAELHWQCSTCYETEPGAVFDVPHEGRAAVGELRRLGAGAPAAQYEAIWGDWMAQYSRRKFTFWKDRLPALAGVVQHYQDISGDRPILGMWERSFGHGLLWVRMGNIPGDGGSNYDLSLPSWSWLACPAEVAFDIWQSTRRSTPRDIVKDHASIIRWNVTWHRTPFVSAVTAAHLVLRGPAKEILLEPVPGTEQLSPMFFRVNDKIPDRAGPGITSPTCTGQFDSVPRESAVRPKCLLLRSRMNMDSRVIRETFLILEGVTGPKKTIQTYRRIGIGCFIGKTPTFNWTVQEEVELV